MNLTAFNKFILEIPQTPYPPYHKGFYLERYFIDFYIKNRQKFDDTGYQFLPICWTDLYNHRPDLSILLEQEIQKLDVNQKYFTVSQHDDAPAHRLPPNTLKFSAGGNQPNCIPIPLICSSIENIQQKEKDIFCSFVGSATHPIRIAMLETLVNYPEYILKPKNWSLEVRENRKDMFLDITNRSKFTLCPRGYGATSFRLYEAMQLRSIPVYIYDTEPYIPYKNDIKWENICVFIKSDNISNIDLILKSISDEKCKNMLDYTKEIYLNYFTLEGMCINILEYLKNGNNT